MELRINRVRINRARPVLELWKVLNVSAKRQIFNNRSRQNGTLTRILYSEKKPIVKQKNYAILSFAVYQNRAET